MAVYCEPRTDTELLDGIGDAKRILLAGCPYCANVSYALLKKLPLYDLTPAGLAAVSTRDEIDRLTALFAQRGVYVDSWLPSFPSSLCMLNEGARGNLREKAEGFDTIITLSCETGMKNAEGILAGKRVVGAMNARGLLAGVTKVETGKILVDARTVYVKRFVFE
jgi:hypothetical protein